MSDEYSDDYSDYATAGEPTVHWSGGVPIPDSLDNPSQPSVPFPWDFTPSEEPPTMGSQGTPLPDGPPAAEPKPEPPRETPLEAERRLEDEKSKDVLDEKTYQRPVHRF